jgi:hypothetical protein
MFVQYTEYFDHIYSFIQYQNEYIIGDVST